MNIILENAASPLNHTVLVYLPFLRRVILGVALALYLWFATKAASELSGAHANPLTTWAHFRLGNISLGNTIAYIGSQFAGAMAAVLLLKLTMPALFGAHPLNYSLSAPQATYNLLNAYTAEFIISFIFITCLLFSMSAGRLEKYSSGIACVLICLFFVFEQPYSGMSLNPARSFAGAWAAGRWTEIWVYFTGPVIGMLLATENFVLWQRYSRYLTRSKYLPEGAAPKRFWFTKDIPHYPKKAAQ